VLSEYLGKFNFRHQVFKKNLQNIWKNNGITFGKPQLKSKAGSGILYANSVPYRNAFKVNATQWHWSKYVANRTPLSNVTDLVVSPVQCVVSE
jgi:hypothetical protein